MFVDQNLVLALAKDRGVTVTDQEIDTTISRFRDSVTKSGQATTFDEVIQNQLGLPGGDSTEFRQFASFFVARQRLAETLVTTDTVRQELTAQVSAEAKKTVMKANVAHILITVPQGADAAADATAKAKAEDIIKQLDQGAKFEDLAKQYSEDPGSKDKGGLYEGVTQGQMVPEFDKATFEDLKPGETTKTPVKTQFGYHVMRLISREEGPAMTDAQVKETIEQHLPQQVQQEQSQAFEKLLTDTRAQAKKDGRLVEPEYPTPTPAAPPAEQSTAEPGQAMPPVEQPTAAP